jgi:hypothetical protein
MYCSGQIQIESFLLPKKHFRSSKRVPDTSLENDKHIFLTSVIKNSLNLRQSDILRYFFVLNRIFTFRYLA